MNVKRPFQRDNVLIEKFWFETTNLKLLQQSLTESGTFSKKRKNQNREGSYPLGVSGPDKMTI